MVTWIGGPVLDPLGAALGQGFSQGLAGAANNWLRTSDFDSAMLHIKEIQEAQQRNMMGIGAPQNPTDVPGPADWTSMVKAPKYKTTEMQKAMLQLELGRIMDPMQRAQTPFRVKRDNEYGLPEGSVVQFDANNAMKILWQPAEQKASDFFRQPFQAETGEWRKGLYSADGELVRDLGPATPSEIGESRTPVEQQRHDAAIAAGNMMGTPEYWDFIGRPSQPTVSNQLGEDMAAIKKQMKDLEFQGKAGTPEYQSLQQAWEKNAKLTGSSINIGGEGKITQPTRTRIEEQVIGDSNFARSLSNLSEGFKSEYFEIGPQIESWLYNNLTGKIKSIRDVIPKQTQEFYADMEAYRSQLNQVFNEYRKVITGAQAGMPEIQFLKKSVATTDDSPEVFKAKARVAEDFFSRRAQLYQEALESESPLRTIASGRQLDQQVAVEIANRIKSGEYGDDLRRAVGLSGMDTQTGPNSPGGRQPAGERAPGAQEMSSLIDGARQKGATEQDIINLQIILQSGDRNRINAAISRIQGQ